MRTRSAEELRGQTCPTARARVYYDAVADVYGNESDEGWFSWVRRREVNAILRFLEARPGQWILDAGCGPGRIAGLLRARGARVHGVDVSQRMLARAAPSLDASTCGDICTLDLGRRFFDAVLCAGALEFAAEPRETFQTLARHVGEGGTLVLLGPSAGFFGGIYRRVQRRRGMNVTLVAKDELLGWAREADLRLVAVARPFFHCRVWKFVR